MENHVLLCATISQLPEPVWVFQHNLGYLFNSWFVLRAARAEKLIGLSTEINKSKQLGMNLCLCVFLEVALTRCKQADCVFAFFVVFR